MAVVVALALPAAPRRSSVSKPSNVLAPRLEIFGTANPLGWFVAVAVKCPRVGT